MQVTHVVSLGRNCRPAWQARRFWKIERAYPFDWWITPVPGFCRFLCDWDVNRLYRGASELIEDGRIASIWHEGYDIRLYHEFTRAADGSTVLPGWRAQLKAARDRTGALMRRFDALDGGRPLFLREANATDTPALLEELKAAVERRLPAARPEFVVVAQFPVGAPGWRDLVVDDPFATWTGDIAAWTRAFASLDVTLAA